MQNLLNPVVPSPAAPASAVTETPSTNDNVTAITTDSETTDVGLHLPMSRIKKIIKLDPEHISSTESANYVLGVATELFIKQLTLDSSTITKNKGRKKITYDDMHHVVSSADIYSFMRDIVPKRAAIGELMSKGIIKLRPADEQRMRSGLEKFGYVEGGEGPGDQLAEDVDLEGDVEVEVEEIGVEDGAQETEKGGDVARDDETIDDDGMDVDIDTDAETEAETGVQAPFGAVENTVDNETVDEDEDGEEEDVDDNRDEVKAGAEAST